MNDFALQTEFGHGAVGNESGARQVSGVLQDSDEQEQQQDLWQENDHGAYAA